MRDGQRDAPRDTMAEIVDLISDSDDDAPPPAPAQALPAFVTADRLLPIKREWFEAICYGKKRVEFREASQYWRSRLLGKAALNVRLVNGRGDAAPFCVYETTRVELLATGAIPAGLAPAPGTAAHRELFKGVDVVIALHLGRRLAPDPKTGARRHDPSRVAAAAGGRRAARAARAGGRRRPRRRRGPADVRHVRRGLRGARGAAERSAARNDGGPRGNVFGFDGKKGLKGVVSKEHERRDAQKFQGMSSLKKALKGKTSPHFPPAAAPRQPPPPPPRDADDLRQKRLARFG
ncbi:ubiquitin-protein transferase [Aureococcus anophagefferens]|nr:ubiquitin-protein transferase [Aureococcus anophagefferens]